jgi:secondary thiamine-phosphate synthase enzyme
MKSYRKEIFVHIPERRGFINLTSQVEVCLKESGIMEGLCLVNPLHITASVFINDNESGLHHDYEVWLEKIAPTSLSANTGTIALEKTMPMHISSARFSVARWS